MRAQGAQSIIQNTMPLATSNPDLAPACDCHFHVFNAHDATPDARYVPTYSATLGDWESHANSAGVSHGVAVQPSFLGADNRQLLRALAQRPQTLRGVAVVEHNATVEELRALHDAGVRGVRLNLMGAKDDAGTLRALPASWWSALIAADMHLELHADIGRIAALLPLLPGELTVVLDHFAKPHRISAHDDTVRAVARRKHCSGATYVTLSAAYRQAASVQPLCTELASLWLKELGAEQLLWGSDWPCTNFEPEGDYAALVAALSKWLADSSASVSALAATAQRLYWR
jgi:predicted TIM-barrel fold metal-dependent hydrolase